MDSNKVLTLWIETSKGVRRDLKDVLTVLGQSQLTPENEREAIAIVASLPFAATERVPTRAPKLVWRALNLLSGTRELSWQAWDQIERSITWIYGLDASTSGGAVDRRHKGSRHVVPRRPGESSSKDGKYRRLPTGLKFHSFQDNEEEIQRLAARAWLDAE